MTGLEGALEIFKMILWAILNFFRTVWETPLTKIILILFIILIILTIIVSKINRKKASF